jgi:ribosome-associated protein
MRIPPSTQSQILSSNIFDNVMSDTNNINNDVNKIDDKSDVNHVPIEKTWSWIPPRDNTDDESNEGIKTIPGQLLTSEEVIEALKALDAENIVHIPLNPKLDTISEFIIVSGRSLKHLRKMSEILVKALKKRNLRKAPGYTGAEGGDGDEWIVVDCYNLAVHLMLPRTRQAINLEDHWKGSSRPVVNYSSKPAVYEKEFEELLEMYPPGDLGHDEKREEIFKQPTNIPRL